ncbi:hypothetical protein QQ045_010171 [Rhodiola kirilowii]
MCDTKSSFFLLYSLPYTLGYNSQSTDLQPNQPKHSSLSDDGRSDHPLHGRHPRDDWRLSTILCSEVCFLDLYMQHSSIANCVFYFSHFDSVIVNLIFAHLLKLIANDISRGRVYRRCAISSTC